MKDQIKVDNQNNQEKTENIISGVIQKLKKPKVIVLVVLSVILSLGGIFAGVYYRQKQIVTNQEKKTIESQKSNNVLNNTKALPFLEILDTKNQIPVELREEPTAISISSGKGCQPDFFDPQTTKYEYLPQTEKTGSYWAKDIYQIRGNDYNYKFSINTISAPPYTITDYEFGCASSFDHVLDIRKDNKRISLYTHVNTFYLSGDKNLLFLDNYLKNQKGMYDRKRRIISMDGTKKTNIPSIDCVSRWANWTSGNRLITYSDQNVDTIGLQGKKYNDYQTKVCIWDNNGNLLNKLQSKLTWYGSSSYWLWGLIGFLPKEPNVFFAYDMDTANNPHQCSVFLQDLNEQKNHKTIALFPEEGFNRNLCPNERFFELDLLNTTFENPIIRFKVNDGAFGTQGLYANFRNWRTVDETAPLEKIISTEITYDCYIKVVTTNKVALLTTSWTDTGPSSKCYQFVKNIWSPSGQYAAFEGISGGLDSQIRVFALIQNDNRSHNLDVLGTSTITDLIFLPNDKLVVLNGFPDETGSSRLLVYDIPNLYKNYPNNLEKGVDLFSNIEQNKRIIKLPDIGRKYNVMSLSNEELLIHGTQGINSPSLRSYNIESL
jgi:hypothetical protein